jgi:hypothetical protein
MWTHRTACCITIIVQNLKLSQTWTTADFTLMSQSVEPCPFHQTGIKLSPKCLGVELFSSIIPCPILWTHDSYASGWQLVCIHDFQYEST